MKNFLIIEGCKLQLTCTACPEQYDVYFDGVQIGYLRLRHGTFRAIYPDYGGLTVFTALPRGEGVFDDDERIKYLTSAVKALIEEHNKQPFTYDESDF